MRTHKSPNPQKRAVAAARRLPVSPDAAAERLAFFAAGDEVDARAHAAGGCSGGSCSSARGQQGARGPQAGEPPNLAPRDGVVVRGASAPPLPFRSSLTPEFLALFAQALPWP